MILPHEIEIREIEKDEVGKLTDLLYEAIYQPDKSNIIPRSILKCPEIAAYINCFGSRKDDYCLVAHLKSVIVGAVWVRIIYGDIRGFGNIDAYTPEFAISLYDDYRNKGIGTLLMLEMIRHLKEKGYKQASLSVNKNNYALKIYLKLGFEIIKENDEDLLMLLKLNN